ncbi:MAG: ribonuclease P protein component [Chlamydiae bacterium]|nr:ribonuclease P protein component [Chlamydiota bacterium]
MDSVQECQLKQAEMSSLAEEQEAVTSLRSPTRSLSKRDFAFLKAQGSRTFGKSVRFHYFFGTSDQVEFGVTAFKSGGNAVCRNRFKRLSREVFRKFLPSLPRGLKLQVLPLLPLEKISYQAILVDFEACMSTLNRKERLKP